MSTTYQVSIELSMHGDLNAKVGGLNQKLETAHTKVRGLGHAFAEAGKKAVEGLDGAIEKIGEFAAHHAKLGAIAGVGLLTYGVAGLNKELEEANISLAAVFNAQGFAGSFQQGLTMAADTVAKMKQDVKTLPGDLGQLTDIFKMISTPAAQAGASVDQIRKLAGQTMIVGGVMGLDTATSSREMAMLLAGRAGAHNILGSRLGFLGDSAKALNAAAPAERLARVSAEIAKYQPAIDAYGRSFVGMFTTLKDNIKYQFLAPSTEGLFGNVKRTLGDINHWFETHSLQVTTFAEALSTKLSHAWEYGERKIEEWGPLILNFVESAYGRLVNLWERVEPYAEKAGEFIKNALADPNGTMDKLVHVLELYAALKVGGGLLESVGIAGIGGLMRGGAGLMSKGVGALAGIGELGSASVSLGGFASAVNRGGIALAGFLDVAIPAATTLGAVTAAAGGLYLAYDQITKLYHERERDADADNIARRQAGEDLINSMTELDYTNAEYQHRMRQLIDASDVLQASILLGAGAMREDREEMDKRHSAVLEDVADRALTTMSLDMANAVGRAAEKQKNQPKHPGGAGGHITINVTQTISSNESPDRVARIVMNEFQKINRHPRVSRAIPNFSSAVGPNQGF